MKKLIIIVGLLVSLGLVGGVIADHASAMGFGTGGGFGLFGAKKACAPMYAYPCAPYYCAPYWCGPAYACKPRKAKAKAPAAPAKAPVEKKKPK
jgi:hypothetical protein